MRRKGLDPAAEKALREKVRETVLALLAAGIYPAAQTIMHELGGRHGAAIVQRLRDELVAAGQVPPRSTWPKPKMSVEGRKGEWGETAEERQRVANRIATIRASKEPALDPYDPRYEPKYSPRRIYHDPRSFLSHLRTRGGRNG